MFFDCLFVFPIITQEPLDRFVTNFNWGTRERHGNIFKLGLEILGYMDRLSGRIAKILLPVYYIFFRFPNVYFTKIYLRFKRVFY